MLEPWEPKEGSNRGAWIVAGAIVVAALIVAGVLLYLNHQDQEEKCAEIRGQVDKIAEYVDLGCAED